MDATVSRLRYRKENFNCGLKKRGSLHFCLVSCLKEISSDIILLNLQVTVIDAFSENVFFSDFVNDFFISIYNYS